MEIEALRDWSATHNDLSSSRRAVKANLRELVDLLCLTLDEGHWTTKNDQVYFETYETYQNQYSSMPQTRRVSIGVLDLRNTSVGYLGEDNAMLYFTRRQAKRLRNHFLNGCILRATQPFRDLLAPTLATEELQDWIGEDQ